MVNTVLLVDDEPMLLLDLGTELRAAGFHVIEAYSGDAARALIERGLDVDIVCTDVRMPGKMDGIALARWVKATRQSVPVILVSGEVTGRDVPNAGDARLAKPISVPLLLEVMRKLLSARDAVVR